MKCLCVGNAACDIILQPSNMELVQDRLLLNNVIMSAGGDALDVAVDLAILGDQPALISCIGMDDFGSKIMKTLTESGVDTRYMIQDSIIPTTTSILLLKPDGERQAAYRSGGNERLSLNHVPDEAIEWADHVHLGSPMRLSSMDGKGTAELFRRAKLKGKTTSMDLVVPLDNIWLPKIEEVLHYCDIFLPSDYEVSQVCGLTDPLQIKEFFRPYGLSVFGIKMGANGVFVTDYKQDVWLPASTNRVIDTLGAGDSFVAAFLSSYKKGFSLRDCAAISSIASGFVVQELGTTHGMKSFDDLYKEAKNYFNIK